METVSVSADRNDDDGDNDVHNHNNDGRTTAYRETGFGDGPLVCYVHGAGGSHQVWVEQYGDRAGPPAVAVDLAGHGTSEDVNTSAGIETLEAYADDVVAVCEETDATVLCGNSMGGAVSLWIALERDIDLDALILCDTGAKLDVDVEFLDTLARDFEAAIASLHAPNTFFHDPSEDLLEISRQGFLETGQAVTLRDFETCDTFDVRDRLEKIDVPTLAVCGEHDPLTPPTFHEYLEREISDCEYVEIADAAHLPMLERPEAFNETLRSFLS